MADDWANGTFDPNGEDDTRYDYLNFGEGGADGKSVEAIEDDANRQVPIGVHTFYVKKVVVTSIDSNKDATVKFHKAFLGTEPTGYHAYEGRIEFAMLADPTRTISYTFRTPPTDPGELHVYMNATKKENGHPAGQGWYWKTLKHLLGKMGFAIQDNGQLPPDARTFGSWKRWPDGNARTVVAEVVKGTPIDKENPDPNARVFNQFKPYSFKETPDTLARRGHQLPPSPQPQTPTPTPQPTAPTASTTPPIGTRVYRPADDPRGPNGTAAPAPATAPQPAPQRQPAPVAAVTNFDDFNV